MRLCEHSSCQKEGTCKAPKKNGIHGEFHWFCREHARDYNASWNYLAGKSAEEIEQEIRRATVWERPTWPFGKGPLSAKPRTKAKQASPLPPKVIRALHLLGFTELVTQTQMKARYRQLAKKYHPDANEGSHANLEKFHLLQEAFATMENYYAKNKVDHTKSKNG